MTISQILATMPGLTYRQLDHWLSRGYVRRAPSSKAGSGNERYLTPREARILHVMFELVKDGVNPEQAAKMARRYESGRPLFLGGFELTRPAA